MKATIESTNAIVSIGGVETRVWEGYTERGKKFVAYIALCQALEGETKEFDEDLERFKPPDVHTLKAMAAFSVEQPASLTDAKYDEDTGVATFRYKTGAMDDVRNIMVYAALMSEGEARRVLVYEGLDKVFDIRCEQSDDSDQH